MRAIVEAVKRDGKAFKGTDGVWYSTRDASCANLTAGVEVEFENEQNGRWNNIKDNRITVVTAAAPAAAAGGAPAAGKPPPLPWNQYNDKEWAKKVHRAIGRQNALTNAVAAIGPVEGVASLDRYTSVVLRTAQAFAAWTAGNTVSKALEGLEEQAEAPTPPPAPVTRDVTPAPALRATAGPSPAPAQAAPPAHYPHAAPADFDDDLPF